MNEQRLAARTRAQDWRRRGEAPAGAADLGGRLSPDRGARRDAALAHRRARAPRSRSPRAAASRSWRSGTAAFFPPPTTSAAAASSSSPARTFDGEWIAGIIERFGYGTARGSTSRGARKALLQLTRDMAAGKPAGFTLDGPRGPARVAQPGAVWLAKATGNPGPAVSPRGRSALDAEELGSHADSQAVRDRRDRDGRAVRRAAGRRRGGDRSSAAALEERLKALEARARAMTR